MTNRYRILFGLILCFACFLPSGIASSATRQHVYTESPWLQGWPMVGHDPQRTSRSPNTGPLHPRLLFTHKGFYAELAGPDGSLYGWNQSGRGIAALDASGRTRWTIDGCCEEGYPALAPDGVLYDAGGLSSDQSGSGNGTTAIAVRPDGSVKWRIDPFGLAKGAVALVSPDNLFYAPVIGPHNGTGSEPYIGLNIVSPQGQVLQHLAQKFITPSLGQDGTIYDANPLRAADANGKVLWRHGIGAAVGPVVGRGETIYVGTGHTLAAYTSAGALRWKLRWGDGTLALAERADGSLLVAGRSRLGAVSFTGRRLWSVRIRKAIGRYDSPSLVVDSAGTAYVGTSDGKLRIISQNGRLVSALSVGPGDSQAGASAATCILGPDGRLIVNGTDGVLRVYGS
jgi:outer membrane protein assembly factor BamB